MINAILQARFSSSRLPGKVLKPVLGKPMLLHQIERLSKVAGIDRLIVATSQEPSDLPIVELCQEHHIDCFQGDLGDVLDRFYHCAEIYPAEHIVRLTGDCPLVDPQIIDELITFHLDGGFDYSSNCIEPTLPDGLDAEIMRLSSLETAWREAQLPSEREHVTPYLYNNPHIFHCGSYRYHENLSALRWTVDEASDFEFITKVYERLYEKNSSFSMMDILQLMQDDSTLQDINSSIARNQGLLKSLAEDENLNGEGKS